MVGSSGAGDAGCHGYPMLSGCPLVHGDGTVGENSGDLESRCRSAGLQVGRKPQAQQVMLMPAVFGGGTNDAVGDR